MYPKTMMGMIAVICYALFAIPIMSMWLMQIGSLFAAGVRWVTNKITRRRKVMGQRERPGSAWSTDEANGAVFIISNDE